MHMKIMFAQIDHSVTLCFWKKEGLLVSVKITVSDICDKIQDPTAWKHAEYDFCYNKNHLWNVEIKSRIIYFSRRNI